MHVLAADGRNWCRRRFVHHARTESASVEVRLAALRQFMLQQIKRFGSPTLSLECSYPRIMLGLVLEKGIIVVIAYLLPSQLPPADYAFHQRTSRLIQDTRDPMQAAP
jgi:hypothetical protein